MPFSSNGGLRCSHNTPGRGMQIQARAVPPFRHWLLQRLVRQLTRPACPASKPPRAQRRMIRRLLSMTTLPSLFRTSRPSSQPANEQWACARAPRPAPAIAAHASTAIARPMSSPPSIAPGPITSKRPIRLPVPDRRRKIAFAVERYRVQRRGAAPPAATRGWTALASRSDRSS